MVSNYAKCADEIILLKSMNKLLLDEVYLLRSLVERGGSVCTRCRKLIEPETIKLEIEPLQKSGGGNRLSRRCRRRLFTEIKSETHCGPNSEIEPQQDRGGSVCPVRHCRRVGTAYSETPCDTSTGIEPLQPKGGSASPQVLHCQRPYSVIHSETQVNNEGIELLSNEQDNTVNHPNFLISSLKLKTTRLVTANTPKSTSGLVYNFLNNVDIGVAFAFEEKGYFRLSKGGKIALKKSKLTLKTWESMIKVKLACGAEVGIVGDLPMVIVIVNEFITDCLAELLSCLNNWAMSEYPLRIGIDDYKGAKELSPLFVLQQIERNSSIFFYFYTHGLRDMDFVEIKGSGCQGTIPGSSNRINYQNSMIEIRNIVAGEDDKVLKDYTDIMTEVLHGVNKESAMSKLRKTGLNIINNLVGNQSFEAKYNYAFSLEEGGRFVPYDSELNKFSSLEQYLLVSKKTKIRLNCAMLQTMNSVKISEVPLPVIEWVAGVPGSGKTHFIIAEHCPGQDLILTLTKEGCTSIRDKMRESLRWSEQRLKTCYRTLASLLVNGTARSFNVVFIDEALLMHAGFIGYVVALTSAKKVVLVGDEWQLPFMDREGVTKNMHCSPRKFCDVSKTLSCSRRCPLDVCFALAEFYPGIYSASSVVVSMSLSKFDDEAFRNHPNTLYMTHTQDDKEALVNLGLGTDSGSAVLTVHEAQGLTYEHVVLVRFNKKPLPLFQSTEHAIVAISRHTKTFKYVSQSGEDMVIAFMKKVGYCLTDLSSWNECQKIRSNIGLSESRIITSRITDKPRAHHDKWLA